MVAETLADAVHRLHVSLEPNAGGSDYSAHDLARLRSTLVRILRARMPSIDETDAAEVVDSTIERFVSAVVRGKVLSDWAPAGYLVRILHNEASDFVRYRGREEPDSELINETVAPELISATSADDRLRALIRRAKAAEDPTAVRVIATWVDLADEMGRQPTLREVAKAAGLSHTGVRKAYLRLREYSTLS